MTKAMQSTAGNTSASIRDDTARDDPGRLVGHDILADQITVIPDKKKSSGTQDDTACDDPRRLVGHDISADQITVIPDKKDRPEK